MMELKHLINLKIGRPLSLWSRLRCRLDPNAAIWILACLAAISLILLLCALAPAR
jgi:hypothetical protein